MVRVSRLSLEHLEDRSVPATWGNPWPDAAHLTLSFAPDGTTLGTQSSSLFQTLNAIAPTATWQRDILRAFQTWAAEAGLNIGLVGDGGQALGVGGRPQGDARFGDIRLAAGAFSDEVLAISSPFDITAGTSSGDVRLNSNQWNSASGYDLYTALLQEAGHVLGLPNSDDINSVMYEEYMGQRTGLSSGDIAAIQALYGTRADDSYEGSGGNNSLTRAAQVGLVTGADGLLSLGVDADLGKGDRDFYQFRAPSLTGGLVITLERAGLSLLTPRVTVYDSFGRVVGSAVSTDPTGGNLTIRLNGVKPLGNYRIAVEGASGDVFDVGSYRLTVRSLPVVNSLLGGLTSTVQQLGATLVNNDLHTNDSFLTASNLLGSLFAPESRFDVAYQGSISDRYDVDYYRVVAPSNGGNVMQVMAWGVGQSELLPRISVYDANRNLVDAEVLVNEAGVVTLQIRGVQAGATYFVKVESAVASGPAATGNYFLGIDFTSRAIDLTTFADSQLDATKPAEEGRLVVQRTGVFHFVLDANANEGTGVQLTVTDRSGNIVGQLLARAGESVSLTLLLTAGDYTVRMAAYRNDGLALTPVQYQLRGIVLSDPIGPQAEDTTDQPPPPPSDQPTIAGDSPPPPPPSDQPPMTDQSSPPPSDQPTIAGDSSPQPTAGDTESSSSSWYFWDAPPDSTNSQTSNDPYAGGGPAPEDPAGSGYQV